MVRFLTTVNYGTSKRNIILCGLISIRPRVGLLD